MKKPKVTHVCLVETVYSLFLYMLIVSKEDFEKTFFFCSNLLPSDIVCKLPYVHQFKIPAKRYQKWLFRIKLYWTSKWRWPFVRTCNIFGSDNYLFSSGIVRENEMTLIEDGASNYSLLPSSSRLYWVKRLLMGTIAANGCGGVAPNIHKILLTGLLPIPILIRDKVELISISEKWIKLPVDYQRFILTFFDTSFAEISKMKNYTGVLFTQPMFEDGLLSKSEEIALYKKLLSDADVSKLVVKVHPRDTLDYKILFPNAYIYKQKTPMELLTILGVRFKDIYTVFSTAALSLPYKANIHFLGTTVHPNLLRCRGRIEYTDKIE